jgi:hypothetical protein
LKALCLLPLLLLPALPPLPALAGTGYVPFVAASPVGAGRATRVGFDLFNLGAVPRQGSVRFVVAGENGNAGGASIFSLRLEPGRKYSEECCDNGSGLLILSGAPQIEYDVYLRETFPQQEAPNTLGFRLPVVTSKEALPAGSRGTLQILSADGAGVVVTSFGILNLGHLPAHCTVDGFPPYVEQFVREVTVPPVSVAGFPDIFLRPTLGAQGRPTVICDQPFYPFALIYHGLFGNSFSFGLPWVEFAAPVMPLGSVP